MQLLRNLRLALQRRTPCRPEVCNYLVNRQIDPVRNSSNYGVSRQWVPNSNYATITIREALSNRGFAGGIYIIKDLKNDPDIQYCAEYAVADYNLKMMDGKLELVEVVSASYEMVAGVLFHFVLKVIDKYDGKEKIFAGDVLRCGPDLHAMGLKQKHGTYI